jgi:hypothetical protein
MSDLLLGFVLGIVTVAFVLPMKGVVFTIREQRQQIRSLASRVRAENGESGEAFNSQDFPNRKENS